MRIGAFAALLALAFVAMVSCVAPDPSENVTETWCYYDSYGVQVCNTCTGSACVCGITTDDLCNFGVWERVCGSCFEGHFYQDLYYDSRYGNCSPAYLCALCRESEDVCDPYLYPGPIPPPPPHPMSPNYMGPPGPPNRPQPPPDPPSDFKQRMNNKKIRS
jgi:hypothetical protein